MSIQEKEAESPNLRELEEPIHPAEKTMKHKGEMQGISSHKLG
jgi:hypothetical protein